MGGDPLSNRPQSPEGLSPPPSSMTFNLKQFNSNQERNTRSSQQQSTRGREENDVFGEVSVEDESTNFPDPTLGEGKGRRPSKNRPIAAGSCKPK